MQIMDGNGVIYSASMTATTVAAVKASSSLPK
jgi:hypothetical protein